MKKIECVKIEGEIMLEYYNRLYIKRNPLFNTIWDIAFAIVFTICILFFWTEVTLLIKILLSILSWIKATLSIICFIKFRKENTVLK